MKRDMKVMSLDTFMMMLQVKNWMMKNWTALVALWMDIIQLDWFWIYVLWIMFTIAWIAFFRLVLGLHFLVVAPIWDLLDLIVCCAVLGLAHINQKAGMVIGNLDLNGRSEASDRATPSPWRACLHHQHPQHQLYYSL